MNFEKRRTVPNMRLPISMYVCLCYISKYICLSALCITQSVRIIPRQLFWQATDLTLNGPHFSSYLPHSLYRFRSESPNQGLFGTVRLFSKFISGGTIGFRSFQLEQVEKKDSFSKTVRFKLPNRGDYLV